MTLKRDHGGGLDQAVAKYGGDRMDWLDLSTGINPVPYPLPSLATDAWTALPDQHRVDRIVAAARRFWGVPDTAGVTVASGASALIAQMPRLVAAGTVRIPGPTYNEHAASFALNGWRVVTDGACDAQVVVHPNNPDGRIWSVTDVSAPFAIIDESFCDVTPHLSLVALATRPGTVILKSFGKFWGLAGLRLGFAIGDPTLIGALSEMLGPWPVSGIALDVGATALEDMKWSEQTRARLERDVPRLDGLMAGRGAHSLGGTSLFRLYRVDDAAAWQDRLARAHIWTRMFPYANDWIRLGLPAPDRWAQLEGAL